MTALEPGAVLSPLTLPPIDRTTLALFAGASGDHNGIHIDLDVARAAGHDDVVAHGMLSMAYLGRYVTTLVPQAAVRSLETRFTAITPVHAAPTCCGEIAAVETVDGERRARLALTVTLADGTVTLRGEAVVALDPTGEA